MKAPLPAASMPGPSDRTAAAIDAARKRDLRRTKRVRLQVEVSSSGKTVVGSPHTDQEGHGVQVQDAFGTASPDFALGSLAAIMQVCTIDGAADERTVNAALALIDGIRPEGELEGALATQIAATHVASLRMLQRAASASTIDRIDSFTNASTKLARTMVAQVEALAKLRRGGEQNVTVKHVHVHQGGQAIVGNVTGGTRGRIGKRGKPHAQIGSAGAISLEEMRGEDAIREALPIASGGR